MLSEGTLLEFHPKFALNQDTPSALFPQCLLGLLPSPGQQRSEFRISGLLLFCGLEIEVLDVWEFELISLPMINTG